MLLISKDIQTEAQQMLTISSRSWDLKLGSFPKPLALALLLCVETYTQQFGSSPFSQLPLSVCGHNCLQSYAGNASESTDYF